MVSSVSSKVSVRIDLALGDSIAKTSVIRGVQAATYEAEAILVDLLSQPGAGKVYKRGKKKHRASKPGDPPAVDTGNLRRNRSREVYETPSGALGVLGLNMEYAEALELGTEKIEPRPSIGTIPANHGERLIEAFRKGAGIT
jgi:hypothetical protein